LSWNNAISGTKADNTRHKRLALAAVIAFYGVNGHRLTQTNHEAYDLVIDVAAGNLDSVDDIAARLRTGTEPRSG
jgi:death-on-curing protein